MTSSPFFDVVLFLLSNLVTGPRFMLISSLVLELWQFSFVRGWPEIQKSKMRPSEFRPISGDWGGLVLPIMAGMSVIIIKCYWMLQDARFTAFTVFELVRENPTWGGGVKLNPPSAQPNQIRFNSCFVWITVESLDK